MAQYDIMRWFTEQYVHNKGEHYTATDVSKALQQNYRVVVNKLHKLWIYGYLVKKYEKPVRNGVFYYNSGNKYMLNPQCANTMKILFKYVLPKSQVSNLSKEKIPNIRAKLKQKKNSANGELYG